MAEGTDIGYYTLPVILSFDGIDRQVTSKLSKAFGDVGKKASKSLADNTEADIKRATDAYGKLRDKAEDAIGKVRVEEERLAKARAGGKTDQIVAAEERLNKARRDAKRITKDATAGYEELRRAQDRVAQSSTSFFDKLRGAGGAAASSGSAAAAGFVDGFGGPIAALGTKAGPIGLALTAAAALGLGAGKILADNILAGMDQLQEQANVAAKLGLTAEQIKPIARAAAEAYVGNFGDSIESNMDAARAAIQGGLIDADASEADVQRIVEQLSTVATVTGEDIPAAVRSAQQAVRTGLADDVTGALDLIVRAQQNGLNVSNDLLDTINEYGTQFRKLGLSGEEAFGLIAQAVQGGARDTDTAADALKEFTIRAIDGSESTGKAYKDLGLSWKATTEAFAAGGDTAKQMFQEVVSRIAAVEDPTKRAQIQVALFGTKAEDLGDAINSMDLSTAVDEFGQVEGAVEQAAETVGGTAAASWESAKRSIEVAADGIQQSLAEVAGPALQKLADWVIEHREEITDFFVTMGHVAIDAGAFIVRAFGDAASMIGQIIQPIGDVQGAMLKFQAWQADIRGDDETARTLREQAEEAFGWGEGLTATGEAMKAIDPTKLHEALDGAAEKAGAADEATTDFTATVENLDGKDVSIPVEVTGLDQASADIQAFLDDASAAVVGINAGALLGAGIPAGVGSGDGSTGSEKGLQPNTVAAKRAVEAAFPEITTIGGWRPQDGFNEHFRGEAIDIMIPDWGSASGKAYGDRVAQYLLANAAALGIDYVLWQQRQWNADGTSSAMGDRGDPTQNHMDHVHAHTVNTPQLPGAKTPPKPAPSTAAKPGPAATPSVPGSSAMSSLPPLPTVDTSGLTYDPQVNSELVNAYGPGYEPGIGTPGVDEYGELGYYRVDERALRNARRRVEDSAIAVQDAEIAAQEARDARAALDDDPNADETAIAGADRKVLEAERKAARAREDAAYAATDAAEAAKGRFTKAKEVSKTEERKAERQRGGAGSQLGGLGSIFSSFLGDTFGIGSWLPGLDNIMPLQAADSLIGALAGPLLSGGMAEDTGTSNAAFGLPDITAPPMPAAGVHGGGGAPPGPATIVNVDNSQNFNNSPVGADPAAVEKARQNNINRSPRLPIGMGG